MIVAKSFGSLAFEFIEKIADGTSSIVCFVKFYGRTPFSGNINIELSGERSAHEISSAIKSSHKQVELRFLRFRHRLRGSSLALLRRCGRGVWILQVCENVLRPVEDFLW